MEKQIKTIVIHDEICEDCFYNEEGACNKDPEKCVYNLPPADEEEEKDGGSSN